MFSPHPGYSYGTCTGYRSASRMSYGPRSSSAMGAASNGSGVINTSRAFVHDVHSNGDNCSCYVEEQHQPPQSPSTGYGEYMDTGSPFGVQRSPLGGYRTFHFSPSPQRYNHGGGEPTVLASTGSLPRSRAPSRSTVTFQSPSVQQQQQPIKLDLRGPVEIDAGEAAFSTLPPRPMPRSVNSLDDNNDGD